MENKYGDTALILASRNGHLEIVKHLLSQGADIEAKNNDGNTPLISASRGNCLEIVKYLLSQGADIEVKNEYGNTFDNHFDEGQKKEIFSFIKDIHERKRMIKPHRKRGQ